jgi:hypothetical protein
MEAHPTLPDREYLERMRGEKSRIIEETISEPPSAYHSEKYIREKGIDLSTL